jgi:tRNA A37 threonylcarbamoyladenosine synthetase subunit TsaC/SUA5/YrdC
VTRELLARSGPLAVTSANLHGEPPLTTAPAVREVLGERVAVVLEGGVCDGAPSTVVRLPRAVAGAEGEAQCLRAGAIDFAAVLAVLAGTAGAARPRD